jgi:formylglycine-generating enzyme required for sulfatase activity
MVVIKGGTFKMGCRDEGFDWEFPAHKVKVSSFKIAKYEVTQKQWVSVMGNNPSHFKGDNLPVENVSWLEIQEFIAKLNKITGKNYRLPMSSEFEYAARGGKKSKNYKYSGSNKIDEVAWYAGNSDSITHPVGMKKPNELGLYDMCGNVYEWCNDIYEDYYGAKLTFQEAVNALENPTEKGYRVIRGGGWNSGVQFCRVSYRICYDTKLSHATRGFRLVLP